MDLQDGQDGRTAGKPAVLAFFDWDNKLPNFQKKMAAIAAWKISKYWDVKGRDSSPQLSAALNAGPGSGRLLSISHPPPAIRN